MAGGLRCAAHLSCAAAGPGLGPRCCGVPRVTAPPGAAVALGSMSAPVPEPRAVGQPRAVLAELSAALGSPGVKASERAEDAVIHTAPCEEEAARNKEQFPELMDLGPGPALRAWLLEPGFGLEEAKTHPHALVLQQPDFQQPDFQQPDFQQPAAEEPSAPGGDASPAAEPQKKSKKRKRTSNAQPHRKVPSRDALGRLPRLRPLYQYINLPTPELMSPWEGDGAAPAGRGAAPGLERELQQGSPTADESTRSQAPAKLPPFRAALQYACFCQSLKLC
ncbi:uncharacterized protein C16orf86 homolog isoform X2 [Numida meleagris]|uniref:uncharacterized protein C16orf86 homolog isoform X2 n=1 Tax=Numida meleagris TaxID=8996 RepID=UPI000B3DDB7F|nr:uncharacterized protein C16orf86 homolog isoform X2 [Numida meleagris]